MEANGHYKKTLEEIQRDLNITKQGVTEIKDDLAHSIDGLAAAVTGLTNRFELWVHVAENQIPIKAVMMMFLILVLALVGVEGADWLFKTYLKGASL